MLIECDLAQPLQLGQNHHVKTLAKYEGFDTAEPSCGLAPSIEIAFERSENSFASFE
jgi:hypothetical protein